jgi:hypothetical protein
VSFLEKPELHLKRRLSMHNRITFGKRRIVAAALLTLVALGVVTARWTSLRASAGGPPPLVASPTIQGAVQLLPWTAVGSTGAVDDGSLQNFGFFEPFASYRPGSMSVDPLVFRYNVTNPGHDTPVPGWMNLYLSSWVQAAGSAVGATLIRVDRCTGEVTPICTTVNSQITEKPICTWCSFAATDINFDEYLYYVRVQLDRADQPDPPRAYSVRLDVAP